MRLLIVTEKCGPEEAQRDGGARLVATLQRAFGEAASIAQFGDQASTSATWHFPYPHTPGDRFARRLTRGSFIAERIREIVRGFTDVVYVHTSMQFEVANHDARIWTFPMFLTPSYLASGETVPAAYTAAERVALSRSYRVLTPSHLERRQLTELYGVPEGRVRVVPRGIDRALFPPRVRSLEGPPLLCSVGSIKRQKNTLGLLRTFAALLTHHPSARLRVIGPVQDDDYAKAVQSEAHRLGISDVVELTGHVPPDQLAEAVADAHLHLSAATCETFGRAIFETLASGLPNVARASGNAAAELLAPVPYARFVDGLDATVEGVNTFLSDLPRFSAMAVEVGELYDDDLLARILAAEVAEAEVLAVADWDGTLFHKADAGRTARSVQAFNRYARRVVCSARSLDDLRSAMDVQGVGADWIVASSGAVVADRRGRILWRIPVDTDAPCEHQVIADREIVQLAGLLREAPSLRVETYQGVRFATSWRASKLHALVRLIRETGWHGRVRAFGDGPYDEEMLAYFDGALVGESRGPSVARRAEELSHV